MKDIPTSPGLCFDEEKVHNKTKPGFTAVDTFESRYQDEYGMYCGISKHVLMCTAYTNLANTFRISFLSKNSDLSSMLEA